MVAADLADATARIAGLLIDQIHRETAHMSAADRAAIGVAAATATAVSIAAAHNCVDAAAAVALVRTIAESVAADIYSEVV